MDVVGREFYSGVGKTGIANEGNFGEIWRNGLGSSSEMSFFADK